MNDDWKKDLPKLKQHEHYVLPNGATVFPVPFKEMDGIIYYGWNGNSIHVYSGDTESGADVEINLYDNLKLKIYGWRKDHPRIVLEGDEFPCTLELDKGSMRNIRVVTKGREE